MRSAQDVVLIVAFTYLLGESLSGCLRPTTPPIQRADSRSTGVSTGGVPAVIAKETIGAASSEQIQSSSGPSNGQWVIGYYAGYQAADYPIASIDWTAITHIALASLRANSDASLDYKFFNFNSDAGGVSFARQLSAAAHAHNAKALLMLGGADNGKQIGNAASAAKRSTFASTLVSAATSLGFDGLDLDWEDGVKYSDFVALVQALRAASPGMLLTVPVAPVSISDSIDPLVPTLAQSLDRLNVMTYGGWAMAGVGYCWCSWHTSALSGAFGKMNAARCSAPRSDRSEFERLCECRCAETETWHGHCVLCHVLPRQALYNRARANYRPQ